MIQLCWSEKPEDRPTCAELLEILEKVQKEYESNATEWEKLVFVPGQQQNSPVSSAKSSVSSPTITETASSVVPPNIVSSTVIKMERVASEKKLPPVPPRSRRVSNDGSTPASPSSIPARSPPPVPPSPTRPRGNSENASTSRNSALSYVSARSLTSSESLQSGAKEVTESNNNMNKTNNSSSGSLSSSPNLNPQSNNSSPNNPSSLSLSPSLSSNRQTQLPVINEETQPTQATSEHRNSEIQDSIKDKKEKRHSSKRHSSKRNSQRRQQPRNNSNKDLSESKESESKSLSFDKPLTESDSKTLNK